LLASVLSDVMILPPAGWGLPDARGRAPPEVLFCWRPDFPPFGQLAALWSGVLQV
jgi:hypothetical protein